MARIPLRPGNGILSCVTGASARKKATDAFLLALAARRAAERETGTENQGPAPEKDPVRQVKKATVEAPAAPKPLAGMPPVSARRSAPITVLGIDPGSQCTGWGLVREVSGVLALLECGTIRPKGEGFSERLGNLFQQLSSLVERLQPDEAAVENVHMARNAASALKLGQARGVVLAACAAHNIPIFDWRPAEVKKSVTGTGSAGKEQVAYMVGRLLNARITGPADTTDALAVAICHLNQRRFRGI